MYREQGEGDIGARAQEVRDRGGWASGGKSGECRANTKTPRLLLGRAGSLCHRSRESVEDKRERDWGAGSRSEVGLVHRGKGFGMEQGGETAGPAQGTGVT